MQISLSLPALARPRQRAFPWQHLLPPHSTTCGVRHERIYVMGGVKKKRKRERQERSEKRR